MNPVAEEVPMKLLQIDSSARITSVTRKLTANVAEERKKTYPTIKLIHRDSPPTIRALCLHQARFVPPGKQKRARGPPASIAAAGERISGLAAQQGRQPVAL